MSVNRNSVPGDKSALSPGGVRVGTPAMTTRGMKEADFVQVRFCFFRDGVRGGVFETIKCDFWGLGGC